MMRPFSLLLIVGLFIAYITNSQTLAFKPIPTVQQADYKEQKRAIFNTDKISIRCSSEKPVIDSSVLQAYCVDYLEANIADYDDTYLYGPDPRISPTPLMGDGESHKYLYININIKSTNLDSDDIALTPNFGTDLSNLYYLSIEILRKSPVRTTPELLKKVVFQIPSELASSDLESEILSKISVLLDTVFIQDYNAFKTEESKAPPSLGLDLCENKPIVVEIDSLKLSPPRKGLSVEFVQKTSLHFLENKCEIEKLQKVTSLSLKDFSIRRIDDFSFHKLQNNRYKKYFRTEKHPDVTVLADGSLKIQKPNYQLFLVSPSSEDEEIALIKCMIPENDQKIRNTSYCVANSSYGDRISISYRFFTKKYSDTGLSKAVQDMKDKLKNIIIEQGEK